MGQDEKSNVAHSKQPEYLRQIFDDYEARANFVGFFDLLYKVDRRLEPERYEDVATKQPLP